MPNITGHAFLNGPLLMFYTDVFIKPENNGLVKN